MHALDQLDRLRSPEALSQAQLATHVVISKLDLVDDAAVDAVRERVRRLNPTAEIVARAREDFDAELVLDRFAVAAADDDTGDHLHDHAHDHLDVELFAVDLPGELDGGCWESWLGALIMFNGPDVFRIKAILAMADEPRRQVVHGVQTYVEAAAGREWQPDEARSSRIVIIGRNLDSARWRTELERCVVAPAV